MNEAATDLDVLVPGDRSIRDRAGSLDVARNPRRSSPRRTGISRRAGRLSWLEKPRPGVAVMERFYTDPGARRLLVWAGIIVYLEALLAVYG